ncbi:F-box protein MET30 [Cyberlindnera fabianii]|uniref:F-box protein MET30 n=1 Tax=Cyberlindnera fabianii TaxID=36022 RepID=A0A1V2L198_CYBFA|nr:F-box protein MET30 [Cyberlindnera fabianii]
MVQQNDASASHPGHMDLALSCVTDIRDKFKAVKESDDQENRVNESAIDDDDDDDDDDHNETDGLGPLPERSSDKLPVYDMSLIPADNFHKFCYRHNPDVKCNKQTDANKMTQLQQDLEATPRADREQINQVWSIFGAANTHKRNLILQGILTQCCFPQLSFISQEVSSLIRIDFISTLPIELSLKILCYLDCTSLCNAAQVSKGWKKLADDDRVWHHMCEQHIDRKCPNCGWGLPLMHMKRAREIELSPPSNEVTLAGPYGGTLSNQTVEKGMRKTRPWKVVYMERFKVERNWRKGTYKMREFDGHSDGVLTLKFDHKYMFTGSYDTTVKIWDVNTGKLLRSLESHTAAVKTLAFDEQKVITGSLDNTIKKQDDDVTGIDYSDPSRVYPNYILTASLDNTIKLWDVKTGKCVRTQFGHVEGIWDIAADTFRIVSGAHDRFVKIWDLQSGKCMHTFPGHSSPVTCVGLGDSNFASADEDGKVRMFSFDNFD